jgi:hypothetical protein
VQELAEKYPTIWILIYNGNVVAHGDQVGPALKKSKEHGWSQPYLRFIERDIHVYTQRNCRIENKSLFGKGGAAL